MIKNLECRRLFLMLVATAALLCTASCAKYQNRDNALNLRVGMTKEETLAVMGEPLRGKQYCRPDVWFYYIETRWCWDFQSTRDECMPIVFKDGKIAGWGVQYYKCNVLYQEEREREE